MKKRRFSIFFIVFLSMQSLAFSADDANSAIGRITYLDMKYWGMRLSGSGGEREASLNGKIYEHDIIQTIAHQHLVVLLEDGTELLIGPSSRIVFKNWRGRDSEGRRIRSIQFATGMMKAKVRKIYSQEEPFLVENKNGVVAVRGTEFVTEAGSGGRLGRLALTQGERATRNSEIEVHTLEGEVHLARTLSQLKNAETRVAITAGQTSLVRTTMQIPQQPHAFDVTKFTTYLAKASPGVQIKIVKNTTNEQRASLASNAAGKSTTSSPAQPSYAKTDAKAEAKGRSIASVSGPGSSSAATTAQYERRKSAAGEAAKDRPPVGVGSGHLTTDGVHQAFQGNEQDIAGATRSTSAISSSNGAQIGGENRRTATSVNLPSPFRAPARVGPPRAGGG
ncbi:MAG: FecR domain-containing protein [Deltaproteobacteria bacterium]|nr:FecR domain-containing protein [Deltaproteobacteria bacterium]